jgi:hypothetical protein
MNLNVYYDLKYAPVTFDFATFLVLSNAVRQNMGLQTMSVQIVCDQFRSWSERDKSTDEIQKRWRLNHILSKLPFLIPEVDDFGITEDPLREMMYPSFPQEYPPPPGIDGTKYRMPYQCHHLTEFYGNKSINLRPFKASEGARNLINSTFGDNVITISLRTSKFQTVRNSNLDEWYKVYQELKNSKFKPLVIPDFEDYMGDKLFAKYDWEIYEPAVMDMDIRLAVYEKSADNLCINNGIIGLLCFSDCNYRCFKFLYEGTLATNEKFHKENHGISHGENFIFAAPTGQNLVWETDNADLILKNLTL